MLGVALNAGCSTALASIIASGGPVADAVSLDEAVVGRVVSVILLDFEIGAINGYSRTPSSKPHRPAWVPHSQTPA